MTPDARFGPLRTPRIPERTSIPRFAASSLLSLLGRPGLVKVDLVRLAAYHMCVLVWLVYIFFRPEAAASPAKGLKKLELESWDHQLERMVHPWSRP